MADYSDFKTLKENVWRAAIDKYMQEQGYYGDSHSGYTANIRGAVVPGGLDHDAVVSGYLPGVKGPTGAVVLTTTYDSGTPLVPETSSAYSTVDPWTDFYQPWIQKIEDAFTGWDTLPDPALFATNADHIRTAITSLTVTTGDAQSGGSLTGDKSLVELIGVIAKYLGPDTTEAQSSVAISIFDQYYGAAAQELVIGNMRQAVIVLGLAIVGEQKIWEATRADIAQLAVDAEQAFKNASPPDTGFTVVDAFLDLVGAVIPPAAAVTGAVKAGVDFVDAVKPPEKDPEVNPDLKGDSSNEVYTHLLDSITKLNTAVSSREEELHTMLTSMFATMNGQANDFTFYVKSGLEPEVDHLGQIRADPGILKRIGYTLMPQVAAVVAGAVPQLEDANGSVAWLREWTIGYGGALGPWEDYFYLDLLVREALGSNANQLVGAGAALARAGGDLHDTDGASAKALKGVAGILKDAGTGWPHVDTNPDAHGPGGRGGRNYF